MSRLTDAEILRRPLGRQPAHLGFYERLQHTPAREPVALAAGSRRCNSTMRLLTPADPDQMVVAVDVVLARVPRFLAATRLFSHLTGR